MSKKRNYSNVKNDNPLKKEARINARKSAEQARKKKQMQQMLIGGAVALVIIVALTLALLVYYGDNVVARINGTPIRASELAHQRATAEQQLTGRGADLWTQDWERDVREEMVRIVALPVLYRDFGRNIGIDVDDYDLSNVMISSVTNAIVEDPVLFADFEEFMPEGPSLADMESEANMAQMLEQAARDEAHVILDRALAGEDFSELMFTYSEDHGGLDLHPNGYTFVAGQMVNEFYEGTKALEIGEIGMVQSQFGFHIILRIEPDPHDMMSPVDAPEEELLGAKHILIAATRAPSPEEISLQYGAAELNRMRQAVSIGFNAKLNDANLVFRPALNRTEI